MISPIEIITTSQNPTNYSLFVDLDGVLVDFVQGYKNLTGITPQQGEQFGIEKFWEPISKAGAKYWITLKWMRDGKQLWDYISKYNPILLSAPSKEESSKIGKRIWVKRELPGIKLILTPAHQKKKYATENSILIDDRKENIEDWISKGGIGILHTSTNNTIKQLQKLNI